MLRATVPVSAMPQSETLYGIAEKWNAIECPVPQYCIAEEFQMLLKRSAADSIPRNKKNGARERGRGKRESQQKKKEHFSITPQQQTNMRWQFHILRTCNEAVAATDAPEAAAAHSKLSTTTWNSVFPKSRRKKSRRFQGDKKTHY